MALSPDQTTSIRQPFIDVPFEDAEKQIRLLELKPGSGDDEIVGSLSVHARSSPPEFEAISYTWGDSALTKTIKLDGTPFEVTLNSWAALRQVRLSTAPRVVWMDTICIDQENDDEKSRQVQGMESIYRGAKTVLASLGASGYVGDFLFESITKLNKIRLNLSPESADWSNLSAHQRRTLREHYRLWDTDTLLEVVYARTISVINWFKDLGPDGVKRLLNAVRAFGESPYWNRLWVYLELSLATNVTVFYGSSACNIETWFTYFQIISGIDDRMVETIDRETEDGMTWRLPYVIDDRPCLELAAATARVLRAAQRVHLTDLDTEDFLGYGGCEMVDLAELECAEPRDRIFALIPLVQWKRRGLTPIRVDYRRSKIDLALECLRFCENPYDIRNLLSALYMGCKHNDDEVGAFLQDRQKAMLQSGIETSRHGTGECRCASPLSIPKIPFRGMPHNQNFDSFFRIEQYDDGHFQATADKMVTTLAIQHQATERHSTPEEGKVYNRIVSGHHKTVLGPIHSELAGQVVAIVPSNALPGDLVVIARGPDHIKGELELCEGLVLRRDHFHICKVVGYALVSTRYIAAEDANGLRIRFSAEDALAFALHGRCFTGLCPRFWHITSNFAESDQTFLAEVATSSPYSSYIYEKPCEQFEETREDCDKPTEIICAKCGGSLNESYRIMDSIELKGKVRRNR